MDRPPNVARRSWLRPALLGSSLVALTVAGVLLTERADARRSVRQALEDGAQLDDSLHTAARARPLARMPFPAAIALGYLARVQTGLGSPFRLVDLARSDPRLPAAWRPRVANAILARLRSDSGALRALPNALDVALTTDSGAGRAILRVVDSVLTDADDPSTTLDAVRIAAAQASARGTIRQGAVPLIDAAALLTFDRIRASRDLDRAMTAAARADGDLLQLIATWRTERRFLVERPLLADVLPSSRRVAAQIPAMLRAIESAAETRVSPSVGRGANALPPPLPPNAAAALGMLISVRTRPAQPQVRLSVLDVRGMLAGRTPVRAAVVSRLLLSARNEEQLVMALATTAADTALGPVTAAATLLASQGMRTLAQESAFHPGVLALQPEQVAERLGLASLTFGGDVPVSWQPFYAREFAGAVDALRVVFPRAGFTGLNVHIGDSVQSGALAVHHPRTRRLMLPLATGFGAVGHELMHDLDWQSARDYSGRVGTYATDNAWRGSRREPLAAPLARLAEFVPSTPVSSAYNTEARRPAELLARGADWFLAAALARHGRINGALSAVQDGWIRGYASATGPAAFGDHAAALSALFDAMPTLAVHARVSPRADSEREPELGSIARAAWFAPIPPGDSLQLQRDHVLVPASTGPACSPVVRLRLAPILTTARSVATGFIEPRIDRSMRRWARSADTGSLSPDAALLRLALLGAPIDGAVVNAARTRWIAAAWRSLPCLAA